MKNDAARLTDDEVRLIRLMAGRLTASQIAREMGVSRRLVGKILRYEVRAR